MIGLELKGKQVKVLCDLVTVIMEQKMNIPLGNWEGAKTMILSRNTCHDLRIYFARDEVVLMVPE